MTAIELKTRLTTLLASQLGTYREKNSGVSRGPAIYVGDPPDWDATGLEVIIDSMASLDPVALHASAAVTSERRVRLIPHDPGAVDGRPDPTLPTAVEVATRRILTAFTTNTPAVIPANEPLGILAQTVITVRS